jgi:hypothetical protein
MNPEILDEDLEPNRQPKPFEAAFSIEGTLFMVLFLSIYLGYWFSYAEQGVGLMGEIWMIFAIIVCSVWQLLGSFLWQMNFQREKWRTYHLMFCGFVCIFLVLSSLDLINFKLPFFSIFLMVLWQGMSLVYIYICFFRKKLR